MLMLTGQVFGCCRFLVADVCGGAQWLLGWLLWWRAVTGCCFSAGVCGGEPHRVGIACCFSPGCCGGEPCRADVACWGGWGPHTPCARQIGPTLPSPPRHPVTARCAACGCAGRNSEMRGAFLRLAVQAFSGSPLEAGGRATTSARSRRSPATRFQRQRVKKPCIETVGAHGIARARGEPFRQSLLAVCGGRLTHCSGAERSSATLFRVAMPITAERLQQHHCSATGMSSGPMGWLSRPSDGMKPPSAHSA